MIKRLLKFLAALGSVLILTAAEDIGPIELLPAATAGTRGILLGDLAKDGVSLPKLVLAPAPSIGRPVVLTRLQISDLLAKKAPDLACSNWLGAERVRIVRATRTVEEAQVKDLLKAALQKDSVRERGELELRFTRPWNSLVVPDEELAVRIVEIPSSGVSINFICRFELLAGGEPVGTFYQPLQARIWKEIYVARSGLMRGQLLRDADLALERRDILGMRDFITEAPLDDPHLELRENVQAGSPLSTRSLRMRAVIKRGRLVDALLQDESLTISVKAEALEDGVPGQYVRLRNVRSKREFKGKVQNEQTVTVVF